MTNYATIFELPEVLHLRGIQNNIFHIKTKDIYYIRANALKCYIMCEGCLYHVRHPLIQLEELMPEDFIRFNRSFIINPDHIIRIYPDCIEFDDYSKLIISRAKAAWLKEYLGIG